MSISMKQESFPGVGSNAIEVLGFLARKLLRDDDVLTFARMDTSVPKATSSKHRDKSRLLWQDIVDEAVDGDLDALLIRLTNHTENREHIDETRISTRELPKFLHRVESESNPNAAESWVVCSRIDGNSSRHIPMMDFRCPPSPRNEEIVRRSMQMLGQTNGIVLLSGKSYHFYGGSLISETEWRDFMYRSLLLTPFVDARYIGHRLLSGVARLRLTASVGKPEAPRVVCRLHSD